MEKENEINKFLTSIYDDFFGIEKKNTEESLKLQKEIENLEDFPKIELEKQEEQQKIDVSKLSKEHKDNIMKLYFDKIDKIQITDESKNTLKKMVEYARKYNEQIVKTYIPFNMRIYCDNDETLYAIVDVIRSSFETFKYIAKDDSIETSFLLIEDEKAITDIYSKGHTVIILKEVNALLSKDSRIKDKILSVLEDAINENKEKCVTIIVDRNKQIVDEALSKNVVLKEKVFDFEILSKTPDVNEVYEKVLEKLKAEYEVTEKFEIKLLDYVIATFPKSALSFPEYIEALCEKILFNKSSETIDENDVPEYEKEKSNEEIFAELNELVGLDNVKQVLHELVDLIEFKNKAGDKIKVKDVNLHMVFLGNPGTGKTTVARMIAGILYNLKYIEQNKLIEVSAKDLVAEYVGQTAPKTMAVIEKAMGGVLFIDEAYTLASKGTQGNSYNEECISTLIQAMENYRDNLVVIFAGYTKEMQSFLSSNSGIVSRIGYTLEFKDYTVDELIVIFKSMLTKAEFKIEAEAIEKAKNIIKDFKNTENFGNARFVRNLYEKTVIKHAANTRDRKSIKYLRTITKEDISTENLLA